MKKLIINTILFSFMAFTGKSFAGSGFSQAGTILEVYNLGWTVMVKLSGEGRSYGDCPSKSYYALNMEDSIRFNTQYSQILMAYAAKKTTVFWLEGDSCIGQGNAYQKISSIKSL